MDSIFSIIIVVFSVIIHEVCHGYMAYIFGDPTAKYEGRLTLNPIKHIDFFGSIVLPLVLLLTHSGVLFGWAKPVPYNPYNLKNRALAERMIALAGPTSNISLALIFVLIVRILAYYNLVSVGFVKIIFTVIVTNLALGFFNLLPIPPLDGSKIFSFILPKSWQRALAHSEWFGMFAVLLFVAFFGDYLGQLVTHLAVFLVTF
jgi:Zn-dependent protease